MAPVARYLMENKGDTLPPGVEGKDSCGVIWIRTLEILRLENLFGRRLQPAARDFTLLVPTLRVGMQTGRSASPTGAMVPEFVDSTRPCRV